MLLAGIVGAVLMSGMWKPGIEFHVFGADVSLQSVAREVLLIGLALVSLALTPRAVRERNVFHWGPIVEVAKVFAGIFLTIIPVIAMLQAGRERRARARRGTGVGAGRRPEQRRGLLGTGVPVGRSWTMRRRTWCSSTSAAAARRR